MHKPHSRKIGVRRRLRWQRHQYHLLCIAFKKHILVTSVLPIPLVMFRFDMKHICVTSVLLFTAQGPSHGWQACSAGGGGSGTCGGRAYLRLLL